MADTGSPREFLSEALDLIDSAAAGRAELTERSSSRTETERALEKLKNNIEEEKSRTIASRRQDLEDGYDKKLKAKDTEISRAEDKRSKARKAEVETRVGQQTSGLKDEIRTLKDDLKNYCKQNKLPSVFKSRLYYKLYCPAGIGDWLCLIVIAAVMVGAIVAAYMLQAGIAVFAAILVADIIILAVYISIWNKTKVRFHDNYRACREIVSNIRRDEKGVKNVSKNIRKDKSDAPYDLAQYDTEIAARKQEYSELQTQKTSALYQFDNETKQQLIAEIDGIYAERVKAAAEAAQSAAAAAAELEKRISDAEGRLSGEFVQYIGSENLNHDTVAGMLQLIESGEAASVSDAIAKLKDKANAAETDET